MVLRLQAWGALAVLLAACGGDTGAETTALPVELSFLTFNAALGVGLAEYPEQRSVAIARDLPALDADVVCLQEVWQPEQIESLAHQLEAALPYSHWSVRDAETDASDQPSCSESEATTLGDCLDENCEGVEDADVALCAVANCVDEFVTVSTACQQCVAANQAADVADIMQICQTAAGGAAAYEAQTGLMLLSRHPLAAADELALDSSLGDRGVLSARVEAEFVAPVDVFCTHLAASVPGVPYAGQYESWEGERARQLEQLFDYVQDTSASDGVVALMGDMNCGPETSQAVGADTAAFDRLIAAGYEAPYAEGEDAPCTFCADNALTGISTQETDAGAILDHVLFAGMPADLDRSARRVLDETIEIDVDGVAVQTTHSDHYGVLVSVSE